MASATPAQAIIDLGPGRYQATLNGFRDLLMMKGTPFLQAQLRTPQGQVVGLQFRTEDAYLLAFCGLGGAWYSVGHEKGALGKPSGIAKTITTSGASATSPTTI